MFFALLTTQVKVTHTRCLRICAAEDAKTQRERRKAKKFRERECRSESRQKNKDIDRQQVDH